MQKGKEKWEEFYFFLFVLKRKKNCLLKRKELLQALSPSRWLARGFSIACNNSGITISRLKDVHEDEIITIKLIDGKVESTVYMIYSI